MSFFLNYHFFPIVEEIPLIREPWEVEWREGEVREDEDILNNTT